MTTPIVALHGFLGVPNDFKQLALNNVIAPSIYNFPMTTFVQWAKRFNRSLPKSCIMMGYSMGGRLALHCLLQNPQQFKAAIIIAAHPGLSNDKQKLDRVRGDYEWGERFKFLPWKELISSWNQNGVLQSSYPINRREEDYSRTSLAHCLRYFSLGKQQAVSHQISQLSMPILWLAPKEESERVTEITFKNPYSELVFFSEGGHRFIFEKPDVVSDKIRRFLFKISVL